jgi:CheY-like chemotaxis protein
MKQIMPSALQKLAGVDPWARRHDGPLAIIDIGLPGLDGYQVMREVRQQIGDALTGYGRPEDHKAVLETGFMLN